MKKLLTVRSVKINKVEYQHKRLYGHLGEWIKDYYKKHDFGKLKSSEITKQTFERNWKKIGIKKHNYWEMKKKYYTKKSHNKGGE